MDTNIDNSNQMDREIHFVDSMGLRVFSDDLSKIELARPNKLLITISPNSYGIATKDPYFREALENTDYLTLDGVYFALAAFFMHGKLIKRNQGPDVFAYYIREMDRVGGRVFFWGRLKRLWVR